MSVKPVKLKATRIDVETLKQRAVPMQKGRYKMSTELTTVNKGVLDNGISDVIAMQKALKKLGVKVERPLHYSETDEYKKGDPEDVVPAFLKKGQPVTKKPKRKRVRLSKRVRL